MLKVIQVGTQRPISYFVHPSDTFEPGMIGQMKMLGNDIVVGVSDGRAPLFILDDVRTTAFTQAVIDEPVDIEVPVVFDGYNWVSTIQAIGELASSNIVADSFVADYPGLILNPTNGTLRAPAGSIANFSTTGEETPNAIRTFVRYAFKVPGIPGDDSVDGSGKVTLWFGRGIFQTDQFETDVPWSLNAALFVSSRGKLTTEQTDPSQPGVGVCLVPPTGHNSVLEFMWL